MNASQSTSHIRPVDIRKDLPAIADLIERCFAQTMDDEGREYIRRIRQIGKNTQLLQLANRAPEQSSVPMRGYVWEEDGRVIGNLTLIPLKRDEKPVYFIANVAVQPEYRGRGIGQMLTEKALQHIRIRSGAAAYLQVRDDNPGAVHIYRKCGFREFARRTTWEYVGRPGVKLELPKTMRITGRRASDWTQQQAWMKATHPENVSWHLPLHLERFRPGIFPFLERALIGVEMVQLAVRRDDELLGVVSCEISRGITEWLWLACRPGMETEAAPALLQEACRHMPYSQKISLNYPASQCREVFLEAGFIDRLSLVWMEYPMD